MNKLNEFCKEHGLQKQMLAKLIGCTKATVTAKVQGTSQLSARQIDRIRKEYGLTDQETVMYFIDNA